MSLIPHPPRQSKCQITSRAIAYKDDFALALCDEGGVQVEDVSVDGCCVHESGGEGTVLEQTVFEGVDGVEEVALFDIKVRNREKENGRDDEL